MFSYGLPILRGKASASLVKDYTTWWNKLITMRSGGPSSPSTFVTNFKELAVNNSWHVEVFDPDVSGTMRVYAECLKLVPV